MMRALTRYAFTVEGLFFSAWLTSTCLFAQNYSFDSRKLALGGISNAGSSNIAFDLVPDRYDYGSIVIPFGLIQLFQDRDVFDPDKDDFDLVRIIDYAGNPLHYTFDRTKREAQVDFLKNIIDAGFNRDLNVYRGFTPPTHLLAEGLLAPSWGHTFKFLGNADTSFHGIYVGAAPYVSLRTDLHFDEGLVRILGSTQSVAVPASTTFRVTDNSAEQGAVAITGGYRAKFALPGQASFGGSGRNGIYFAANYHYLWGLRYDSMDLALRIDTGPDGLVTLAPQQTPLIIDQLTSTSGRGGRRMSPPSSRRS